MHWALKTNWGSFNWASAAGCAGVGLEPALGCESSKQASLPSNLATGAVSSALPSLLWTRSARPPPPHPHLIPHHWPCFNKAVGFHLQPARKRRKLAALKRSRGGEEIFRKEKQEGPVLLREAAKVAPQTLDLLETGCLILFSWSLVHIPPSWREVCSFI